MFHRKLLSHFVLEFELSLAVEALNGLLDVATSIPSFPALNSQ